MADSIPGDFAHFPDSDPDSPMIWSNAENIALANYWYDLIWQINGDEDLMLEWFGPEAAAAVAPAKAPSPLLNPVASGNANGGHESPSETVADTPEPVTLILLGGGLIFFGLYPRRRPRPAHLATARSETQSKGAWISATSFDETTPGRTAPKAS
jgi:hypothetical protein